MTIITQMSNRRTNPHPHIVPHFLERNQFFPNNKLPALIYKAVFEIPKQKNKAAQIVQAIFLRNDWGNTWRNGIYDFHHYHSNTHECLGIASGEATVILGGPDGKRFILTQGDLVILPAGTAHKCASASSDFLCVGGYPHGLDYDTCHGTEGEYKEAVGRLSKLPVPKMDPVFGAHGFLNSWWK